MKILKVAFLIAAIVLLAGCGTDGDDRQLLQATVVAKEARAFQVVLADGQRYVCRYNNGYPAESVTVGETIEVHAEELHSIMPMVYSEPLLSGCIPWMGTVTGKVAWASFSPPLADGKQYVSRFIIDVVGKEFDCPVDVEQEKIQRPEGFAEFIGEVTREGCTPM
jgi:hypothetical protein